MKFKPGDKITIQGKPGTVRYFGKTEFAPGIWVGVEMETPEGKNDGCVQGQRYFTCPQNHGRFVRPERVKPDVASSDDNTSRHQHHSKEERRTSPPNNFQSNKQQSATSSRSSTVEPHSEHSHAQQEKNDPSNIQDTNTPDHSSSKDTPSHIDNTQKPVSSTNDTSRESRSSDLTDSRKESDSQETSKEEEKNNKEREKNIRQKFISDMRLKRERARSEYNTTNNASRIRELEEENEQIKTRHGKEISDLKSKLRKAEQMTTSLSERMTKANAQVKEYSQRLEQERHRSEEKESDLSFRVESLELDKELAEERANVAENDLEALRQKFHGLEEQYDSLVNQKSMEDQVARSGDVEGVVKQNQQLKEALMQLYEVKTDLEKKIENMQSEIDSVDSLKERIKELEGYREELKTAKNTIQDLELQVEANAESNAMIEDLAAEKLDLEDKVAELTSSLEEMEEMKQLSDEVEGIQADELRQLGEEAQQATAKATQLSEKLERQQQILSERENTIDRLRTALKDTESRLSELEEAHADTVSESSTIQQRSKEMHDNYNLLLSKVAKLRHTQIKQRIADFESKSYQQQLEHVNNMLPENIVDIDVGVVRTLASASRVDFKLKTAVERIKQDADYKEDTDMSDATAHRLELTSAGHMCFLLNVARMYICSLRSWAANQDDVHEYLQIRRHNPDLCSAENDTDDILRRLANEELTEPMFLNSVRLLLEKVGKLAVYFNDPRWTWMRRLVKAICDETSALRDTLRQLKSQLDEQQTNFGSTASISDTLEALDGMLQRQRYLLKVSNVNSPVDESSVEIIMQCLATSTALFTAAYNRSRRIISLIQDIKAGYRDASSSELISELSQLYTLVDAKPNTSSADEDKEIQETPAEQRKRESLRLYNSLAVLKPVIGGLERRAEQVLDQSNDSNWSAPSHFTQLANTVGEVADNVLKTGDSTEDEAQEQAAQKRTALIKEELGSVERLKSDLEHKTTKLSHVQENQHQLQNQLQYVESENDQLQTELETSNRKVKEYEQMNSYIEDIESLREEMRKIEQENYELKSKNQEIEQENANLAKENDRIQSHLSSAVPRESNVNTDHQPYMKGIQSKNNVKSIQLLLWERHQRQSSAAAEDLANVMDIPVEHLNESGCASQHARGQELGDALQSLSSLTRQIEYQSAHARLIRAQHSESDWADVCRQTSQIRDQTANVKTQISKALNSFPSAPPGQASKLLQDKKPKLAGRVHVSGSTNETTERIPVVLPANTLRELHHKLINV
eukprot:gb/GECH01014156.1/.p1 GENE.gb/GECH01014156.1/~~gb/GECH01014156.1/.p1  ORF type:complete len:1266 (+),score=326.63 gb/GECH01014156.1/:1-3798(+)